jgi:hypothetical protein
MHYAFSNLRRQIVRATIGGIEIEGTPEEIARFADLRLPVKVDVNPAVSDVIRTITAHNEVECDGITEAFAYRTLKRLPLSTAQKALLNELKSAHPSWMLSSQLQEELGCSPTSLGGVLGGLGRRVSATSGYEPGFNLWDCKWDDDEGEWTYRLPQSVLKALERAGL